MNSQTDDLALTLSAAAHSAVALERIAADVLEVVAARMPVLGAALNLHNPISGAQSTLCSFGFDSALLSYLRSGAFLDNDVCYRVMIDHPLKRAVSWRDFTNYEQTQSALDVFKPAGLGGGASVRLTTADGRYTGDLHIGTTDVELPNQRTMNALRQAAPLLATATDVTRRMQFLLVDSDDRSQAYDEMVPAPAVVVSANGTVVVVPVHDVPTFLTNDQNLAQLVARWRSTHGRASNALFHHYTDTGWWRLRLVALSAGTLVEATTAELPRGLTVRSLEVLTLISQGLHNGAIARRLVISERTCAHHVERIMAMLGVESRAAAARLAVEDGFRLLQ